MKKIISLIAVLIVTFLPLPTSAEYASEDQIWESLMEVPDDEIELMMTLCREILMARGSIEEFSLYAGTYIAGEDFKPGTYRIEFDDFIASASLVINGESFGVYVFSAGEEAIIGRLTISQGDVIMLDKKATFYPY